LLTKYYVPLKFTRFCNDRTCDVAGFSW